VPDGVSRSQLLASVEAAFRSLPDRYLGAERDFDSTVHLRLGDVGHTWEIRCGPQTARVRRGVTGRKPDVTISTDAATWLRRGLHPLVRLLRPEFGMLPHTFHRSLIAGQFWAMFHDRDRIDPEVGDLMVEEFRRIYASRGARYAFLSSARNIYLEAPFGRNGFYHRLAGLQPPALFIWGSHDPLIPAAFGPHVRQWLPNAEQAVLDCGHVPQVERSEECNRLLLEFFSRAEVTARMEPAAVGPGQAQAA
jgi:pimeloyl-ACP methyl ester carboxylesterase